MQAVNERIIQDTTDKEELIEKIEDLTAQHAKEKEALQAQLKRKSDDYEAQAKVLTTKNERINHLDLELAKKPKRLKPKLLNNAVAYYAKKRLRFLTKRKRCYASRCGHPLKP